MAYNDSMSARELIQEVEQLPPELIDEVMDFARFLKAKTRSERHDTARASEEALAKDWLRPEEDQAWQNL